MSTSESSSPIAISPKRVANVIFSYDRSQLPRKVFVGVSVVSDEKTESVNEIETRYYTPREGFDEETYHQLNAFIGEVDEVRFYSDMDGHHLVHALREDGLSRLAHKVERADLLINLVDVDRYANFVLGTSAKGMNETLPGTRERGVVMSSMISF